ncbi:MAG TPA: 50S ribosomal protein L17 [Cyclobacteriaceae bacterium]|jgi:large subunit ribosomal protein L17|nr:50S ribosomal protein L17 [Cyclobacteriaceae bacterium]
MRHGKKINHLGRTSAHRHALLSNLASSLILNKRITTTVAKAKELRKYVEPLITKAKEDSTHSRRTVFSYLQNKESVKTLFGEVAGRTSDRPGGYTRIIKLSDPRLGDAADMCLMELVDFNDLYKKDGSAKKGKTRRGRGGKKEGAEAAAEATSTETAEEKPKKAAKKATKKKE